MTPSATAASGLEPIDPVQRAVATLQASRVRLRAALMPPPEPLPPGGTGSGLRRLRVLWRYWRRHWRDTPAVDLGLAALHEWWQRHPWRQVGEAVGSELNAAVMPTLRRHPRITLVAAAGVGAGIVLARPWRWQIVNAQWRLLRRRAVRWLVLPFTQAISDVPMQTVLLGLLTALAADASRGASTTEPPARPAPDGAEAPPPQASTLAASERLKGTEP